MDIHSFEIISSIYSPDITNSCIRHCAKWWVLSDNKQQQNETRRKLFFVFVDLIVYRGDTLRYLKDRQFYLKYVWGMRVLFLKHSNILFQILFSTMKEKSVLSLSLTHTNTHTHLPRANKHKYLVVKKIRFRKKNCNSAWFCLW